MIEEITQAIGLCTYATLFGIILGFIFISVDEKLT